MHPEIKKFWEYIGSVYGPSSIKSWEVHIPLGGPFPLSRIEVICHGDRYRYNKNWYSEEQMLRIIRLKVFL